MNRNFVDLRRQQKIVIRIILIIPSNVVLKVGCGIGALILLLKEICIGKIAAIVLDLDTVGFASQ